MEDALDDQMVKWDFGGTNTTLVLHDRNAEPDICEVVSTNLQIKSTIGVGTDRAGAAGEADERAGSRCGTGYEVGVRVMLAKDK